MESARVLQLLEPVLGPGLKITNCRSEDEDTSTGFLAVHHHVTVQTAAGQSFPLFLKNGLDNKDISDFVTELNLDETELDFYTNLAPNLIKFEKSESGISHVETMIPGFYAGETSASGQPSTLLILENIGEKYFLKSFDFGVNLQEAYALVRTTGYFHAATIAFYHKHREVLNAVQLCKFADYVEHPFLLQESESTLQTVSTLPYFKDQEEKFTTFKTFFTANLRPFADALRPHPSNSVFGRDNTGCILHSDLWANNIMFCQDSGKVKFVDFQMLLQGNPLYDISVAITFNIHMDIFTMENLVALATEYYSVLNSRLLQLNIHHQQFLSMEEFLNQFLTEGLTYSLVYWSFQGLPSKKYPRSLERFCHLLSLTENMWNKA